MNAELSIRVNQHNRNHHLWLNNGTWFIHYTLHNPDYTKKRVRISLGTKSASYARLLRDGYFRNKLTINKVARFSIDLQRKRMAEIQ